MNQSTKTQSKFHHGDLKRALLDAALELLDEQGDMGVGVRAVARKAGVSHAAPVNHFKDRRALLTGLAARLMDDIRAEIDKGLRRASDDPIKRVETVVNTFIKYGKKYPNRYALLWRYDIIDHESEMMRRRGDAIYDFICEEIDRLMGDRQVDRDTIAVGLWSMMHGYIDLKRVGMFEARKDKVTGQDRAKAMIEMYRTILTSYGL